MRISPLLAKTATTATVTGTRSTPLLQSSLLLAQLAPRSSYGLTPLGVCSRRQFHIPNLILPPVIFTGLLFALYTWKSFIMVTLQNKIIYNPYLPPTARHEKISDWNKYLCGVEWNEIHTRSVDRTDLALAVACVSSEPAESGNSQVAHHVYILYCQGSSASAREPFLRRGN